MPNQTISSIAHLYGPVVQQRLYASLKKGGFDVYPKKIALLGFKEEQKLEVYGRQHEDWILLKSYPFTNSSGAPGPKLKAGDLQIPEGIYNVEYLNPNSKYHLSIKIDYPNLFDIEKAKAQQRTDLGGDIFIHGKNETVGCIPIGDEAIEELFILTSNAINNRIPVIISPKDFRKDAIYPNIPGIDWESQLYSAIHEALGAFAK